MLRLAWMCAHERDQPEELMEQAVLAERVGFDAVVCSDLFHPWTDDGSAAGFAWSWLGAVAARTTRLELITTVTAPVFRYHPAIIAQAAATMDRLSGGRFVLGVGTGDPINDAPLGYGEVGYRERAGRLREALGLMRRLWAEERVTLEGRYFRADAARLFSPPLQPLRVWMAADGPRSASLAGEVADGLITSVKNPRRTLEEVIRPFREAADGGRDHPVLATRWCILASDREEAWSVLGPLRGMRVPGRREATDPTTLRERADALGPEALLPRWTFVRNAEEMKAAYRPLVEELGADYLSIQVASRDSLRTMEVIGSKVLPALRSLTRPNGRRT